MDFVSDKLGLPKYLVKSDLWLYYKQSSLHGITLIFKWQYNILQEFVLNEIIGMLDTNVLMYFKWLE